MRFRGYAKEAAVKDWNVVVTVFDQEGYRRARSLLGQLGEVGETEFYNVLVVRVPDVRTFTEHISKLVDREIGILNDISRILPAHKAFDFQDGEDFERQSREVVLGWAEEFLGKSFYIRLHRRGLKGLISSPAQERFLDDALLAELVRKGHAGRISFEDPDRVVDVETVGNRAGMSRWSRVELRRYPFLHID